MIRIRSLRRAWFARYRFLPGCLFCLVWMLSSLEPARAGDAPVRLDCTEKTFPKLLIQGDRPSTLPNGKPSAFRGFADPCIRRDPERGLLWMVYSWPHMKHVGPKLFDYALGVETHLASSQDRGRTWRFVKVLWPRNPGRYVNQKTKALEDGFISHEVPNIVRCEIDGKPAWAGVRLDYFLARRGNYKARNNQSFCFRLMAAASPPELSRAPYITFGHAMSSPECAVDINVCDYSRDFPPIFIPNEPALYFRDGRLYLAFVVMTFWKQTPYFNKSFIAVFSTEPRGRVKSWRWKYCGKLATHQEAKELGGEALTQIELAHARDGRLLAFLTPESWDGERFRKSGRGDAFYGIVHHGCAVVEVAELDPPRLARSKDGTLVKRAWLYSSAHPGLGPGAAAYDAASATGVLYTLRDTADRKSLSWSLHATGLHP